LQRNAVFGRGEGHEAVMRLIRQRQPLKPLPNGMGQIVPFHEKPFIRAMLMGLY
jgi:hypothetical protein